MTYVITEAHDDAAMNSVFQVDTAEQTALAREEMAALGLDELPVYVTSAADMDEAESLGFPDSHRNGQVLVA